MTFLVRLGIYWYCIDDCCCLDWAVSKGVAKEINSRCRKIKVRVNNIQRSLKLIIDYPQRFR